MYFVLSCPVAVRNKMHLSIAIPMHRTKHPVLGERTGDTNLQKSVFSKTEPVWENEPSAVRDWAPLWEGPRNKAGRERWSSAAKKPQHGLQNRRSGWPRASDLPSDFASVMPNPCSFPLPVGQVRSELARGGCWNISSHLAPAPDAPSKGMLGGVKVSVGLCFLEPSEPYVPILWS